MWYPGSCCLIVSFPDLCRFSYFHIICNIGYTTCTNNNRADDKSPKWLENGQAQSYNKLKRERSMINMPSYLKSIFRWRVWAIFWNFEHTQSQISNCLAYELIFWQCKGNKNCLNMNDYKSHEITKNFVIHVGLTF